jgi:sulfite exporter TauE/SafE
MIAALLLGLALGASSALHCVAMCGPLNAFVALDPSGATDPRRVVRYQLGRTLGYGGLGAAFGAAGGGLTGLVPSWAETLLSLVLALSLGVAAFQIWPRRSGGAGAVQLGRTPRAATMRERAARASAIVLGRVRRFPLALGMATALLPCGVIGAGALLAAGTGDAVSGALAMVGLALASGIGVGLAGLALGRTDVKGAPALARAMSLTLVLGALLLVSRTAHDSMTGAAGCHG